MKQQRLSRRRFLEQTAAAGLGAAAAGRAAGESEQTPGPDPLVIDPKPRYELSPYLYMQFMEPLGVTDGSVAAAWDLLSDRWRPDVIEATRERAPALIRWGGIFSDFYRWKEGGGPVSDILT